MNQPDGFIDPHGGFRNLKSYQMAEIVYDATVAFCDRWIGRRSRTHDQMVQAARSGKQNIAEGSMASGTSKKFELKLFAGSTIAAIGETLPRAGGLHRKALSGAAERPKTVLKNATANFESGINPSNKRIG